MKLTVVQRMLLLGLLPKEGDYTTLKLLRQLRETLSFDEAENAALKFKQDGGMIHWDAAGDVVKEIEIGATMQALIKAALQKLDRDKKLTEAHMDLFEKFTMDKDAA